MEIIKINNITKDYGERKGVFDLTFSVKKGEVFGFLGPNGAGKTTTIRQLMGFIHPNCGDCEILGMDCFKDAEKIQKQLGYLPGEANFMNDMTGIQFIHFIAKMKNCKDLTYANELIQRFELNPKGKLKRMSKGMKQKIGIVCAFMHNPEVLILDEPTSGLDPLMQNRFVELILEEKAKGKTILMSSHMFEEVEKTCDRFAMIKDGELVLLQDMKELRESEEKGYKITFKNSENARAFAMQYPNAQINETIVFFALAGEITSLIKQLSQYEVVAMAISVPTLEDRFIHLYGGKRHD